MDVEQISKVVIFLKFLMQSIAPAFWNFYLSVSVVDQEVKNEGK